MIKRIAHLCLESTDLQRTEAFYCEVLGLKKVFEFERAGVVVGYYLELAPGNFIEFFHSDHVDSDTIGTGLRHFCLEVEDCAVLETHLADAGCEPWGLKRGADQSWQLWCKDPDGIPIEFQQYTPESSQNTGATCVLDG